MFQCNKHRRYPVKFFKEYEMSCVGIYINLENLECILLASVCL